MGLSDKIPLSVYRIGYFMEFIFSKVSPGLILYYCTIHT
jgi:hypothetical protein